LEGFIFGGTMEYFDIFDTNGIKLNKTMARGTKTLKGEYHKVVHIWIKNSMGDYLVQQRNKKTDRDPYQWAPTAGAVTSGETPLIAALRETEEEIGLSLKLNELKHMDSLFIENDYSNYIIEMYLVNKDVSLAELTIDEVEVKAVSYMSKEKIYEMIDALKFWDFLEYLPTYDYFSILEKRN
jgi:8-oxo-dGTP pyrophosphatase MutT (NUDIX family)